MDEIIGAHRMRMQLETGEVGHPHERRRVTRDDFFGTAARRKLQRDHLDPRRPRPRRPFLKEELAVDAIWIAHESVRTAAGALHGALRDCDVVARQVKLCVAAFRKEALTKWRPP